MTNYLRPQLSRILVVLVLLSTFIGSMRRASAQSIRQSLEDIAKEIGIPGMQVLSPEENTSICITMVLKSTILQPMCTTRPVFRRLR